MRVVLQRVSEAQVISEGQVLASQGPGFLIFLGITTEDGSTDIDWLVRKICGMRIFPDSEGKMNNALTDIQGEVTVVSQFTFYASCKKGNRPSFLTAAKPEIAEALYESFCNQLSESLGSPVGRGKFGSDMKISLINDGPVTIQLDSHRPE